MSVINFVSLCLLPVPSGSEYKKRHFIISIISVPPFLLKASQKPLGTTENH